VNAFLTSFIRNSVLVNILFVVILMIGGVTSMSMIRELFPEISVDTLQIQVLYPGADPEEVEEGISRKIEEAVDGIEGIKRYRTASAEGLSTTIIEVYENYDMDVAYQDVRNAVDSISTFPVDAEKPILQELKINEEILNLTLWGDQPERVLKEFAEQLKDEIQALSEVSKVSISGTRDYEIAIEVSEEKLREYGLSFDEVSNFVQRGSLNLFGGTVRTRGEEIRLRTVGRAYRGEEFADIVVVARPNGQIIRLRDIATIRDEFTEDGIISRFNGSPAVLIGIFKTPEEDAIAIVDQVREFVEQKQKELPKGLYLTAWADQSEFIRARLDMLVRNGLVGLAIVFFSLWLFLELRLSFWVSMGIPISLSGGLFIMYLTGSTLNTISLFGLIMVLGIVVDDAIIVGEAVYVHRRNGDPPLAAALNGVKEVGLPVFAAVSTSIVAFMPLFFVSGVMGKFVSIIPVAVIATLLMSLFESMLLLPAHLNHLPDFAGREHRGNRLARLARRNRRRIDDAFEFLIHRIYKPSVQFVLHFRYIGIATAVASLIATVGLIQGGHVRFTIFPELDGNDLIGSVEFPNGTPLAMTHEAVLESQAAIERVIDALPEADSRRIIKNIYSVTGESGGGDFERRPGPHMGFVRVELVDGLERDVTAQELLVAWEKEIGRLPGALSQTFTTLEAGPPGAPIDIALRGDNMDTLLAVSSELQSELLKYEGIYQVQDSFRPGKNELQIDLKPEARTLGITLDDLARQVNAGFFGSEPIRLQRGRDDIRVKVRYARDERQQLADLENIRIRTPDGKEVPFFSVADVRYTQGFASIARLDGAKTVSVTAEVDTSRQNADAVLASMGESFIPSLQQKYYGWTYTFDGAQQQSREAIGGLFRSFPIAIFIIFLLIATIFRSYIQPIVIMITIPFGIIGAVLGHLVLGYDLFMFSIFGMVALTGVVVNDAIVMIEAVNHRIAEGMKVLDAIVEGGMRRFRAIMLTSISTVGGLIPIIAEKDAQAQIIIPMALSIAAGVLFATVLTLFFIPCLLGVLNDLRRVATLTLRGYWPTREDVEPARTRYQDIPQTTASGGGALAAK
jgi:multidrug efflux pump subunit AcrB